MMVSLGSGHYFGPATRQEQTIQKILRRSVTKATAVLKITFQNLNPYDWYTHSGILLNIKLGRRGSVKYIRRAIVGYSISVGSSWYTAPPGDGASWSRYKKELKKKKINN